MLCAVFVHSAYIRSYSATCVHINGWIGYTLAWADRQFPELRKGNTFPAKYDRRHNLNAMVHYTLDDHWEFVMTFVYASVVPINRSNSLQVCED